LYDFSTIRANALEVIDSRQVKMVGLVGIERLMSGIVDDSIEKEEAVLRTIRQLATRQASREHYARLLGYMIKEARSWRNEIGMRL